MTLPIYLLILFALIGLCVWLCKKSCANDDWEIPTMFAIIITGIYFVGSFLGVGGATTSVESKQDYKIVKGEYVVFVEFEDGSSTKFTEAEAYINADNLKVVQTGVKTVWGYLFAPVWDYKVEKL